MKRFFTKTGIWLLAGAALIAVVLCIISALGSGTSLLHNALGVIASPFRAAGSAVVEWVGGIGDHFASIEELQAENEALRQEMDPNMHAVDKLLYMNHELFTMIDNTVSVELLARLFSTQLTTKGEKHLLNRDRMYFKLLHQVVRQGMERRELRTDMTANEIINDYAMFERALMYDWCLADGGYALARNADRLMPMFLANYRGEK